MLTNVNVKNLALIREASIQFEKGLNILTGETGAGKSIVIGSISIALGGKISKEMVREGADYGLVELVFSVEDEKTVKKLQDEEVFPEEGMVIISRRITGGRSTIKVNGETKTAAELKKITSLLIDVHGQHDHQSLLEESKHLDIIDKFGQDSINPLLSRVKNLYTEYDSIKKEMEENLWDNEEREREKSFAGYEINEIEGAALREGEDAELEEEYHLLSNREKIMEAFGNTYRMLQSDSAPCVAELLGNSVREVLSVSSYDEKIAEFARRISEAEDLIRDFTADMSDYMEEMSFGGERFHQVSERLDTINRLKQKYGKTIEQILRYKEERERYLDKLIRYEEERSNLEKRFATVKEKLERASSELSGERKKMAAKLEKEIVSALGDLNFMSVDFQVKFSKNPSYSAKGYDRVSFEISTNAGESLKPLSKVASGGELSRIMLGLRTIMAKEDEIETLIFDEIDTGISGRTAQMVAEKMNFISKRHQVICITHLPQIAAMADSHYLIEKKIKKNETVTMIEKLDEEASVQELVRILGGAKISDTVYHHAREMKKMATETKLN